MKSKARVLVGMAIVLVFACIGLLPLAGCNSTAGGSSWELGDGKIGSVPYAPAIDKAAAEADKIMPGAGDFLRKWYATTQQQRVPPGWRMVTDIRNKVTGEKIDLNDFEPVPRLERVTSSVVTPPPYVTSTNSSSEITPELRAWLESLGKGTSAQ